MVSLRAVAERANVSLITAYQALRHSPSLDPATQQAVLTAARELGYRLKITIHDVAHAAGVSIATVSYVMNDSVTVRPATRQRVLAAASALDYHPNSTARNLKASETRLIGHAIHDSRRGQAFWDQFTHWLAHAAEARHYHILTFVEGSTDPLDAYDDLIKTNRVDGFIISNTNRDDPRIHHLIKLGIPFAAFGRANDSWDFPYVDVDGRKGIELAVAHLIAMGHRRIAIMGWPEGSLSGDERLKGYLDGMRLAGIEPQPGWILRTHNTSTDAYTETKSFISMGSSRQPTAIVAVSDTMALGVMNCLEDHGLRVGKDVAVTGFDDEPASELVRPPLTSLRQNTDLIAAHVIELVVAEIARSPHAVRRRLLVPTLQVRGSSGIPVAR